MRTKLPSRQPAVFAAARERRVRSVVKRFGKWHKDAWPILFTELSREGHGFRTCAPGACLAYIAIVGLMVEYLGEKPYQKQFLELRTRLGIDLHKQNAYIKALGERVSLHGNAAFSSAEKDAIIAAVGYVEGTFERIQIYCPDVSRA